MPLLANGRTEEETEKCLGSALLASQSLITIDNVNGELSGDALCQIIERPRGQVRILGRSELVDVETRATTLFANGNNIIIVGDLCRRVIRARLDPKMEAHRRGNSSTTPWPRCWPTAVPTSAPASSSAGHTMRPVDQIPRAGWPR
jgi:hypothetical protein